MQPLGGVAWQERLFGRSLVARRSRLDFPRPRPSFLFQHAGRCPGRHRSTRASMMCGACAPPTTTAAQSAWRPPAQPLILLCGHMFCLDCFQTYATHAREYDDECTRCPTCRSAHTRPRLSARSRRSRSSACALGARHAHGSEPPGNEFTTMSPHPPHHCQYWPYSDQQTDNSTQTLQRGQWQKPAPQC